MSSVPSESASASAVTGTEGCTLASRARYGGVQVTVDTRKRHSNLQHILPEFARNLRAICVHVS
jgi:hypothetical protein